MSANLAIAGADSRIALIRGRIASLTRSTPASSTDGSAAIGIALGASSPFDAFGSVYQEALQSSSGPPITNPAAPSTAFTGASSTQVESVATRVPGRAARASGSGSPASASSGSGQVLSGTDVARMAHDAGFRGEDLVDVVAISKRESNWKPTAFNGNSGTGDRSYGLMQINMIGSLGPSRLQQFGLTSNDQLLDPQTNLDAAFVLYQRSGNSLQAWGGYKGMSNTFGTDLDAARQVVSDAGLV